MKTKFKDNIFDEPMKKDGHSTHRNTLSNLLHKQYCDVHRNNQKMNDNQETRQLLQARMKKPQQKTFVKHRLDRS